jgi:hypothetical protein
MPRLRLSVCILAHKIIRHNAVNNVYLFIVCRIFIKDFIEAACHNTINKNFAMCCNTIDS